VHAFVNELERPVGTYLYGRGMYDVMRYWETAHTVADQPSVALDFARIWQAADKIVYSTTLRTPATARTRIERDFDPGRVRTLKAAAGRDLTVGGAKLAAQAIAAGLVDEYQFYVVPAVVGGGTRALPDQVRLNLASAEQLRQRRRLPLLPPRLGPRGPATAATESTARDGLVAVLRKTTRMLIRPGHAAEQGRLRRIAIESKAHWPYPAEFLARFADVMLTEAGYFATHEVWVAEDGEPAGFYSLIHQGEGCVLDDLWLLPRYIGRGLGRRLFEHAGGRAKAHGAQRMEWEAEPYAVGFYRRMGGVPVREVISGLGRTLPVFAVELDTAQGESGEGASASLPPTQPR
jgi:dihydrofolate reductase/GNAT superfamily N-acetyltransferase